MDSGALANAGAVDLATAGVFQAVRGYYDGGGPLDGQPFGFRQSGILPDPDNLFQSDKAYILADATGANRFPPRDGNGITAAEVTEILRSALGVTLQARAQIRRPLGSFIQVTVSVVDTNGEILGVSRTPDAPIFGTDVSLQKARSAMFFSLNPAP